MEELAAVLGLVRLLRTFRVTLAAFHLLRLNEVPGPRPPAVAHTPRRKRGPTGRYFTGAGVTLMDGGSLDVCLDVELFSAVMYGPSGQRGWEGGPGGLRVRSGDLYKSRGNV